MNRRYTEDLITKPVTEKKEVSLGGGEQDVVIEYLKSLLEVEGQHPLNALTPFFQIDTITQPTSVGMLGVVRGSMLEAIWMSLGQPNNGESAVLWENTKLPRWFVRFDTGEKILRAISCSLRNDYYSYLLLRINDMFNNRSGTVTLTELTEAQHDYFIERVNTLLRDL